MIPDIDDNEQLTVPTLNELLRPWLKRDIRPIDDPHFVTSLEAAFATAEAVQDCGSDEARAFWLELDRGNYATYIDGHENDDQARDEAEWVEAYPEEWAPLYTPENIQRMKDLGIYGETDWIDEL